MKFMKMKAIYKKEILDLLRDKKTMIMMVLVPLLLYPLLMVAGLLLSSKITTQVQTSEYHIAIQEEGEVSYDREKFISILEDAKDDLEYHLTVVESENPKEQLVAEEIDAYIQVKQKGQKVVFDVNYLSSSTNSASASGMIEDKLEIYENFREEQILTEMNLDAETILHSVEVIRNDCSNQEERVGSILGKILPFLLITSILMGAVYPAIDTTAGEKERGTLETLLTLPVRNGELIMGKFLAVATVSVVSVFLNLISMGFMAVFLAELIGSASPEAGQLNLVEFIPALLVVVLCVLVFALFLSALTMCVTVFAKSFKEANNYVTPLLLVVMLAGYISVIPNVEFNEIMATIPVVNVCLLITNLLLFKYQFSLIFIVLITNVAYAILAVLALSKIYDSEELLFGEGGVSLQSFTNRKELKRGGVPNVSDAILMVAIVFLLSIYVGTVVQMKSMIGGVMVTQIFIIGVPLWMIWYTKKDIALTLSLKAPRGVEVVGAIVLEIGTLLVVMLCSAGLSKIFPQDVKMVNQTFDVLLKDIPVGVSLLITALLPAICEEILFRGYLLAAARKRFAIVPAMIMVAAIFGVFHMSLSKFFTTGLLGFVFCYVVYQTGSIFLTCLMHFLNNAVSVVLLYYGEEVGEILPILTKETWTVMDVVLLLVVALVCGVVGVMCMRRKVDWKKAGKNVAGISIILVATVTLTGCGGDYDITTGKGGSAVSGAAVSGSTVSGGAIGEESALSSDEVALQKIYSFCNSKFAYTEEDGKLLQLSLGEGGKINEFSIPGVEFEGIYDENKGTWVELLYASDEEIVYQITTFSSTKDGKESVEIWSVPLRKQGDSEYPDGSKGQKIIGIKNFDETTEVAYVGENYIAYTDTNGYHEYNRAKEKDTFQVREPCVISEGTELCCGDRNQIILEIIEETPKYPEGIYCHSVGSETMELFYQYPHDDAFLWFAICQKEEGMQIYYVEEDDESMDEYSKYSMYCYDIKTKKTECVITPKQWEEMLGGKYVFEYLYENGNQIYLEMSKYDDEMYIPYIFTYTSGSGLQEEKKLNDLLQKRKGFVENIVDQYVLIEENGTYCIYDMEKGRNVENIEIKNNFIY